MPRPKGSKNRKTDGFTIGDKPTPNKPKSQFANTKMAEQLYAEFKEEGIWAYEALRSRYEKLFDAEYFCLIDFDTAWQRLLKKVQAVHGVDLHEKYTTLKWQRSRPRKRSTREKDTASALEF